MSKLDRKKLFKFINKKNNIVYIAKLKQQYPFDDFLQICCERKINKIIETQKNTEEDLFEK